MLTEKQMIRAPRKNYMNPDQLEFFRDRLTTLRNDLNTRLERARAELSEGQRECDELDRAAAEEDISLKVAGTGPRLQIVAENRGGLAANRRRLLRLLPGDGRTDRHRTFAAASDRHLQRRRKAAARRN